MIIIRLRINTLHTRGRLFTLARLPSTVTRFGPKVGQIGPKWDKSGKFSDQIQYILARCAKMY